MPTTQLFQPKLKKLQNGVWLIEYYIPSNHGKKRIRTAKAESGEDLNRITDLHRRQKLADQTIQAIKNRITPPELNPSAMPISQAIEKSLLLKGALKANTTSSYAANARWFVQFLEKMNWDSIRCQNLKLEHVQAYFDYQITDLRVSNNTYNTRKNNLGAIFSELVSRGYFSMNLVKSVKTKPKADPERRAASVEEKDILFKAIMRRDPSLMYACLLLGYCAVRPGEIRDLKVKNVDLKRGQIIFPPSASKNNRNSVVTIPTDLVPILESFGRHKYNGELFLFGGGINRHRKMSMEPGTKRIGKNSLSEKFRNMVKSLKESGMLVDTAGLQFYSLKDTLALYLLDQGIDLEAAMRHFRHSDLSIFQKYVKRLGVVNQPVKELKVDIQI